MKAICSNFGDDFIIKLQGQNELLSFWIMLKFLDSFSIIIPLQVAGFTGLHLSKSAPRLKQLLKRNPQVHLCGKTGHPCRMRPGRSRNPWTGHRQHHPSDSWSSHWLVLCSTWSGCCWRGSGHSTCKHCWVYLGGGDPTLEAPLLQSSRSNLHCCRPGIGSTCDLCVGCR